MVNKLVEKYSKIQTCYQYQHLSFGHNESYQRCLNQYPANSKQVQKKVPPQKGGPEYRQEQFFTLYGNNAQNKKNSQSESRTNRKLVIQKPPVQMQDQPKQRNYIGIIQDLKGHTPCTAQNLFTPAATAHKDKLSVQCQLAKFYAVPSRNQQNNLNPQEGKLTFDHNSSRLAQT